MTNEWLIELENCWIYQRNCGIDRYESPQGRSKAGTLIWIARELGTDVAISLIAQHNPTVKAVQMGRLDHGIGRNEFEAPRYVWTTGFRE